MWAFLKKLLNLPFIIAPLIIILGFLLVNGLYHLPQAWDQLTRPDPTFKTTPLILEKIQRMGTLETMRYNYSLQVSSQRDIPYVLSALYGDRAEYVAVGYVAAGIDLTQVGSKDVIIENDHLLLKLPPAYLTNCVLDEKQSYVINRGTGLFVGPSPEVDEAIREYALEAFIQGALEQGILDDAEAQAQDVLVHFLSVLDVSDINIEYKDDAAPLPPESTCNID